MTRCHTNFIFACSDLPSYTFICPGEEPGTYPANNASG